MVNTAGQITLRHAESILRGLDSNKLAAYYPFGDIVRSINTLIYWRSSRQGGLLMAQGPQTLASAGETILHEQIPDCYPFLMILSAWKFVFVESNQTRGNDKWSQKCCSFELILLVGTSRPTVPTGSPSWGCSPRCFWWLLFCWFWLRPKLHNPWSGTSQKIPLCLFLPTCTLSSTPFFSRALGILPAYTHVPPSSSTPSRELASTRPVALKPRRREWCLCDGILNCGSASPVTVRSRAIGSKVMKQLLCSLLGLVPCSTKSTASAVALPAFDGPLTDFLCDGLERVQLSARSLGHLLRMCSSLGMQGTCWCLQFASWRQIGWARKGIVHPLNQEPDLEGFPLLT